MSNSITQATPGLLNVQLQPAVAAGLAKPGASGANDQAATTSSPLDRTTLSPLGQVLESATRGAIALSSFRPERVAQVSAALADGSYQANFAQVAQRVTQALKGGS